MTVVAGFRCSDGVVLCADTQETLGYTKTHVPKLKIFPNNHGQDSADDLVIAFAGSGSSGPFIDKVVERAWEDVQIATSFDEVCIAAEESIKRTHKEYGKIYQRGYLPDVKLIYGIKMHGQSKLFSSDGPTVSEKPQHESHGSGDAIAKFITSQMYTYGSSLSQVVILAAYLVYEAKLHADGCGGTTHVAKLPNNGGSSFVKPVEIRWIEEHISHLETFLGVTFLANADLDVPDDQVVALLDAFRIELLDARMQHRENKSKHEERQRRMQELREKFKKKPTA